MGQSLFYKILLWKYLISQCFSDQNDFDPVGLVAAAGDNCLSADTVRTQAVGTKTRAGTRRIAVQSCGVYGRGSISDSYHGVLHGRGYFVHTGKNDDIGRTVDQRGDAVSGAVNVYKVPGGGYGVAAGLKPL